MLPVFPSDRQVCFLGRHETAPASVSHLEAPLLVHSWQGVLELDNPIRMFGGPLPCCAHDAKVKLVTLVSHLLIEPFKWLLVFLGGRCGGQPFDLSQCSQSLTQKLSGWCELVQLRGSIW